jgi:hypothetical protein
MTGCVPGSPRMIAKASRRCPTRCAARPPPSGKRRCGRPGVWPSARSKDASHAFCRRLTGVRCAWLARRPAWTDGETLWLPERLERAADANGNRRLYTVLAVQLWAQTRFGSFNVDPEPELSQWADREAALAWFALFEAMRLEARLAQELPGLARDIRLLRGPWPADLAAAADDLARPAATAADSLRWVAERRRVGAGGTPILAHLTGFDPLAARRLRAARIARDAATLRRALNILRANDPHARGGAGDDSHPPLAAEGDAVPADLLSGDIQALPPDAQAAAQSLAQDLDGMPPEILKPAGPGAWQPEERDAGETIVATVAGKPDAIYDEWDYRRAAWRRDWCQLYETEGPAGEDAWVDEVRRRHAHLIRSIRRRFEACAARTRPSGASSTARRSTSMPRSRPAPTARAAANPRRACSSTAAGSNVRWR